MEDKYGRRMALICLEPFWELSLFDWPYHLQIPIETKPKSICFKTSKQDMKQVITLIECEFDLHYIIISNFALVGIFFSIFRHFYFPLINVRVNLCVVWHFSNINFQLYDSFFFFWIINYMIVNRIEARNCIYRFYYDN